MYPTHEKALFGHNSPLFDCDRCPCHGSQYDENGSVLKGPAPKCRPRGLGVASRIWSVGFFGVLGGLYRLSIACRGVSVRSCDRSGKAELRDPEPSTLNPIEYLLQPRANTQDLVANKWSRKETRTTSCGPQLILFMRHVEPPS